MGFCVKDDDIEFVKKQVEFLEFENDRLRHDNTMLLKALQENEQRLKNNIKPCPSDADVKELRESSAFKDAQIETLSKQIANQLNTIRGLQESVIASQVHKIPQYQKTINFLNESVRNLQEENEQLKKKLEQLAK